MHTILQPLEERMSERIFELEVPADKCRRSFSRTADFHTLAVIPGAVLDAGENLLRRLSWSVLLAEQRMGAPMGKEEDVPLL